MGVEGDRDTGAVCDQDEGVDAGFETLDAVPDEGGRVVGGGGVGADET